MIAGAVVYGVMISMALTEQVTQNWRSFPKRVNTMRLRAFYTAFDCKTLVLDRMR